MADFTVEAPPLQKKKKFYNEHLCDSNLRVPRTTAFRRKKELNDLSNDIQDSDADSDCTCSASVLGEEAEGEDCVVMSDHECSWEEFLKVNKHTQMEMDNWDVKQGEDCVERSFMEESNEEFYDRYADDESVDSCFEDEVTGSVYNPVESDGHATSQDDLPAVENKPLYEGAPISLAVSMLLIISFSIRHSLTGVALADLLVLVQAHLISPNYFRQSITTLRKFFSQLRNPLEYHYYCSFCFEYFGVNKVKVCSNKCCLKDFSKRGTLDYFIVIPLINQRSTTSAFFWKFGTQIVIKTHKIIE